MTDPETRTVRKAARQYVRYQNWRDKRQEARDRGDRQEEARFPEDTAEIVIARFVGDDSNTRDWARLASRVTILAGDPSFRSRCGTP